MCSANSNKVEALRIVRTPGLVRLEEELEFLLEFHLVECNDLGSKLVGMLKRLELAEESVNTRIMCVHIVLVKVVSLLGNGSTRRIQERASRCSHHCCRNKHSCGIWQLPHRSVWHESGPDHLAAACAWQLRCSSLWLLWVCRYEQLADPFVPKS
jgi:hypothetical protein